ncbi:hypothetical protein HDU98_004753 [Podochytrium sp. JEL0797]|nr:hypothetical protein HDU98_004753 [Podochytrium sp. JEL0797]
MHPLEHHPNICWHCKMLCPINNKYLIIHSESLPTAKFFSSLSPLVDSKSLSSTDPLLNLELASQIHAAKVQAHFEFYTRVVSTHYESTPVGGACVAWNSDLFCHARIHDLAQAVLDPTSNATTDESSEPLPLDHVYAKVYTAPRAVLYADLKSAEFPAFHRVLTEWADQGLVQYVLRYKPSESESVEPLYLAGYGVELAIKTSEYKVIDDRNTAGSGADKKEEDADLEKQQDDVETEKESFSARDAGSLFSFTTTDDQESTMLPVSAEEIKEIGVKAANIVLSSKSPLDALIQISQDFPKHAHAIAQRPVTPQQRIDLRQNQRMIVQAGSAVVLLNGVNLNVKDLNVFSLLKAMRKELALIQSFESISLSAAEAAHLLTLPTKTTGTIDLGWGDAFDVRHDSVLWWNDLEKDKRYKQFPKSLRELLQPSYPGQLKYVAKNMFNALFVLDLTNLEHLAVQMNVFQFIEHTVPLRFGLVPAVGDGDDGAALLAASAFMHIVRTSGRKEAKEFIVNLHSEITKNTASAHPRPVSQLVQDVFESVSSTGLQEDATEMQEYSKLMSRIGMEGGKGALFLNGKFIDLENWQQTMLAIYPKMLQFLQLKVHSGAVGDQDDLYALFMDQENVQKRRNVYIFPSEDHPLRFVNLADEEARVLDGLDYVSERDIPVVTFHVIADFESLPGLHLARAALEFLSDSPHSRVAFLHNPPSNRVSTLQTKLVLHKAAAVVARTYPAREAVAVLLKAVEDVVAGGEGFDFMGVVVDGEEVVNVMEFERKVEEVKRFVKGVVGFGAGEAGLVVNGRVVGPFEKPEKFVDADFETLAASEYRERVERVDDALSGMELGGVEDKDAGLTTGDPTHASLRFTAVLDPVSEITQKASAILKVVSTLHEVSVQILLNPVPILEDLPIKRFYRYVFPENVHVDSEGKRVPPSALFKNVPMEPLLTLGLDVPRAWVVRAIDSIHDLDNIHLSTLSPGQNVDAHFQLNHLLVEGHARELHTTTPPRGVQFVLGTPLHPHMVDTITMTNLGYLQLKANPGVWRMRLREGRSEEVYRVESVSDTYGGKDGGVGEGKEYATVVLDTFEGVTVYPVVSKRKGMENEDVLEPVVEELKAGKKKEGGASDGVWGQLKARVFGSKQEPIVVPSASVKNTTINIFSVASGHLYERFMGIMMLSVMRHTQSPVKFWLIENFLSPKFMQFVPHLAAEYGFEYEFVTYNWPHWLRATTRKERTIWAYKILFLDVLFPLNLDKVIFVDADQVVRTDMKELVDLDLEGAVYGYTPMGDSRPEMEGFRFWKTGYWASHLQGRPYHISALYVIDLKRFRQLLAGDRLRQQYQQLSADPNSLSNLDQDLPNNMIHDIPIFSLPKEWLWCETWCADSELAKAKTIDLCNNPLTKEPKLKRAKRIIKEWVELDDLVQAVADKVEARKLAGVVADAVKNEHDEL